MKDAIPTVIVAALVIGTLYVVIVRRIREWCRKGG